MKWKILKPNPSPTQDEYLEYVDNRGTLFCELKRSTAEKLAKEPGGFAHISLGLPCYPAGQECVHEWRGQAEHACASCGREYFTYVNADDSLSLLIFRKELGVIR